MAATNTLSDKEIRAALKAAMASGKARKLSDGGGLVRWPCRSEVLKGTDHAPTYFTTHCAPPKPP